MNSELMLAFLGLPENTRTSKEAFIECNGLSGEKAKELLEEASHLGIAEITDKHIQVSRTMRLELAIRCLQKGVDVQRVCRAAGWREFEDLGAMILSTHDYVTKKHFRFRLNEKSFEIDILALKAPWSLVVECKRWKKNWQPASIRKVLEIHRCKTVALAEVIPTLDALDLRVCWEIKLIPMILTLLETPAIMRSDIPIVSIGRFENFLGGFEGYLEDFAVFKVKR